MASITFDGQTLTLDGKRIWLVSGQICYARVPRTLWADRLQAAKLAGLNTIETPVIWARHEPRPGQFDFKDHNDLRHFIELIGQAGMHCILRPGPFVDAGWDNGGLPPWLPLINNIKLRTANQPFLEACSRYITAVAQQVRDLQAVAPTTTGRGASAAATTKAPGPIVLIQNEHAWLCGHDDLARAYLGELARYFREAGFAVPMINANELWQSLEGEIEAWSGYGAMLPHLRQLAGVRPTQPRIVVDFKLGRVHRIGRAAEPPRGDGEIVRALGEVLAGCGQYNLAPFHGGTNYGFSSGRDPRAADAYFVASNDRGAPLTESGEHGENYPGVRRISTFASRFARLLTHLEPARQTVCLVPPAPTPAAPTAAPSTAGRGKRAGHEPPPYHQGVAIVHAHGSQGSIAWVFADDHAARQGRQVTLLLPDGLTLPVEVRGQPVVWCLLGARLSGRAVLDYANLCTFAAAGKSVVLFGPAGSLAMLSINGAPLEAPVPDGDEPAVHQHEGVTVVIASTEQVERIFVDDSPMNPGGSVYLNVSTLDRFGRPVPHHAFKHYTRIDAEGVASVVKIGGGKGAPSAPPPLKPGKATLGPWSVADCHDYTAGVSARYANISKTGDLTVLGSPYGYGWYRAAFNCSSAHKARAIMPRSGHRIHLWLDEHPAGLVGVGPGAADDAQLSLKKGQRTLVALAENLGRVSAGPDLGEHVGLTGDAWAIEPVKVAKPKLISADPIDLLAYRAPLWRVHREDVTDPRRLTWTFEHRRKTPLFIRIAPFDIPDNAPLPEAAMSGLVLLNGKPIHFFQGGGQTPIVLDPATLARGKNELQFTMLSSTADVAESLSRAVSFLEGVDCITDEAQWAFAKWEPPADEAFEAPKAGRRAGEPAWWRASFDAPDDPRPLWFEAAGLSKGQFYINGTHVGRYFVATADGKRVPPQLRYHVPRSMLLPGRGNELMLFDEHGFSPAKVRLIIDPRLSPFD